MADDKNQHVGCTLARLDHDDSGIGTILSSQFKFRADYQTLNLNFRYKLGKNEPLTVTDLCDQNSFKVGSDNQYEIADIPAHTAEFTLNHDEDIVLIGLQEGTNYRITEKNDLSSDLDKGDGITIN